MKKRELIQRYKKLKTKIVKRINEFKNLWKTKDDKKLFSELCFCLLTPQAKAKTCWEAVMKLKQKNLLFQGSPKEIEDCLVGVRFARKKAEYIVNTRKVFPEVKRVITNNKQRLTNHELRKWFVENIKGMGYKEASHFLRNIGLGDNIAILDRHILKNLKFYGVIKEIPKHLSSKRYIEIENKMKEFSKKIGIPVSHLDLLFWSKETGEIFK
ncbi:MAG: N-glycosylase/DNA lyase [Endomicrobiia bacterium]